MVEGAHDLGGHEGLAVVEGEGFEGITEEPVGALGLVAHHGDEAVVVCVGHEVGLGVIEAMKVFEGEVNASFVVEVFADIAEDVGELEGMP